MIKIEIKVTLMFGNENVSDNFFGAMNKLGWLTVLFLVCGVCDGQNLVPNGDLELYSGCPNYYSQIDSALYWINPSLNVGTPDYYNACNSSPVGVPANGCGWQNAHSGVAYAGIILRHSQVLNAREYIETSFTTPLIANAKYYFKMFVSTCDPCAYTTDAIQVYFSDTAFTGFNNWNLLPCIPQISNDSGIFFNQNSWKKVSGEYIAHGGENYLIIGNFKDDSLTILNNSGGNYPVAYVFIDDVCLSLDSLNCNSTLGINEIDNIQELILFPNPFSDKINITVKRNELVEVNFYDITSRKIFNQSFTNSISINTEQLAKGIYIYEVRSKNGMIKKGKVVKE